MNSGSSELLAALWVEFRKAWRSKTLWVSALAFVLIAFICSLFMFILEDPERARSLGLLGAKAQLFGGTADWPSFFSLMLLMVSVGGLVSSASSSSGSLAGSSATKRSTTCCHCPLPG